MATKDPRKELYKKLEKELRQIVSFSLHKDRFSGEVEKRAQIKLSNNDEVALDFYIEVPCTVRFDKNSLAEFFEVTISDLGDDEKNSEIIRRTADRIIDDLDDEFSMEELDFSSYSFDVSLMSGTISG